MKYMSRSIRTMGQLKLLYFHEHARLVRYGPKALHASSRRDYLLASGSVQLVRANVVNTCYLKVGDLTYPILPKLKCWCHESSIFFPVPSGGYWNLELVSEDNQALEELVRVLKTMVDFQSDNCFPKIRKNSSSQSSVTMNFDHDNTSRSYKILSPLTKTSSSSVDECGSFSSSREHSFRIGGLEMYNSAQQISNKIGCVEKVSSLSSTDVSQMTGTTGNTEPCMKTSPTSVLEAGEATVVRTMKSGRDTAKLLQECAIASRCTSDISDSRLVEAISVDTGTKRSSSAKFREFNTQNLGLILQDEAVQESSSAHKLLDTYVHSSTNMPVSLVDLFVRSSEMSASSQAHSRTGTPHVALLPASLALGITIEEWDIVVDEIEAKHRSIARRLMDPLGDPNVAAVALNLRAISPGLIRRAGQLVYLTAHILIASLRGYSSTVVHSEVPGIRGNLVHEISMVTSPGDEDFDLDLDLDGRTQSEINHFFSFMLQSVQTLGRFGNDLRRGISRA